MDFQLRYIRGAQRNWCYLTIEVQVSEGRESTEERKAVQVPRSDCTSGKTSLGIR